MNIVIPMAGSGKRFVEAGYTKPKPFIDVLGKPMIVNVLHNLSYSGAKFILIASKDHMDKEKETVKMIQSNFNAIFYPIDYTTEGAACTVLNARKLINNNIPLVIANSDQYIDNDFTEFVDDCLTRNLDGSIMTFRDLEKNPKWSFAKTNSKGQVIQVKEKDPISNLATVGIYMFSKGSDFVNAALDMIVKNDRVNNEFYVCPVFNYLIRERKNIGIFDIPKFSMHGLGTPDDLNNFINMNSR